MALVWRSWPQSGFGVDEEGSREILAVEVAGSEKSAA